MSAKNRRRGKGPEVDEDWIEKWLDKNVSCDCHEAYKLRKMTDPNCFRHGRVDDVDWRIMLREAGIRVKEKK
jgi:hypothetical protein